MKKYRNFVFAIVIIAFVSGCYYDKEVLPPAGLNNCDTTDMQLSVDVNTIFNTRGCFGCHTPPGNRAGVDLKAMQEYQE